VTLCDPVYVPAAGEKVGAEAALGPLPIVYDPTVRELGGPRYGVLAIE
jgi:hypothetical protein